MARSDFVSSSTFTLPEDILKKLRRSAFITGTAVGPEQTKAAIEGALSVGAERESRLAQIAEDRRFREESLAQQESQFERSQAFAGVQLHAEQREAEKARKTALFTGAGKVATQLLFSPIFSTTKGGKIGITTGISKIGSIIKSIFT